MDYTSLIKEVNIPELVKALRNCAEPGTIIDECDTADDCPYSLDGYCGDCMNNIVKDAAAAIEALQAQLPKRGEWNLKERAHYFKCSICKEPIPYKFGYGGNRYYNFCPRCGADMRKMEVQE